MVIVRKSYGKLRVCVDLRKLNSTVKRARLSFSPRQGKRQSWDPAGKCVRCNAIQHSHQQSFLPRQEG